MSELMIKIKTNKYTKYVIGIVLAALVAAGVITTDEAKEFFLSFFGAAG